MALSNNSSAPRKRLQSKDLLVGLEFEFLMPHGHHDHHPNDNRWWLQHDSDEFPGIGVAGSYSIPMSTSLCIPKPVHRRLATFFRFDMGLSLLLIDTAALHPEVYTFWNVHLNGPLPLSSTASDPIPGPVPDGIDTSGNSNILWKYQGYSITEDSSLSACNEPSVAASLWRNNGSPSETAWKKIDDRYEWLGIELRTRALPVEHIGSGSLPFPESSWCSSREKVSEIDTVCHGLLKNFRLQVNHTCALQVTVSVDAREGLPLLALKRILTLVWLLDRPLLFKLCAPYRSRITYCKPVGEYSTLAVRQDQSSQQRQESRGSDERNPTDFQGENIVQCGLVREEQEFGGDEVRRKDLQEDDSNKDNRIPSPVRQSAPVIDQELFESYIPMTAFNCPEDSKTDSGNTTSPSHRFGKRTLAHLSHLWSSENAARLSHLFRAPVQLGGGTRLSVAVKEHGGSWAVEFRQHEGTLDPAMAKRWARVCVALVRKAIGLQEPESNAEKGSSKGNNGTLDQGAESETAETAEFKNLVERIVTIVNEGDKEGRDKGTGCKVERLLRCLEISDEDVEAWEGKIRAATLAEEAGKGKEVARTLGFLPKPQ